MQGSSPLQFIAVRNVISRTISGTFQELSFFLQTDSLGFGKTITIHWMSEDSRWNRLSARFVEPLGDGREFWAASIALPLTPDTSLPGNIRFAACLEFEGRAWWDSRFGEDYRSDADSGLTVLDASPLFVISPAPPLPENAVSLPIEVAVRQDLDPESVRIHWTADAWKTFHEVPAFFRHDHWDRTRGSNARNPNRYGWGVWAARLPLGEAARIEYAVECRTRRAGTIWDNANGRNHRASRGNLRVLTLNLHTWQEEDQLRKFETIAQAIQREKLDIVFLQEVGELWNDGNGDWATHAARLINSHLPRPYHLFTDWSHIGFDRYREGLAILSRFPFLLTDSGYVSDGTSPFDIHSRRVLMAQIHLPCAGALNLFCAHLSWPEDGFIDQYDRLLAWMREKAPADGAGTLVCGDFNIAAGSPSFNHIVQEGGFEEQFLKITRPDAFQRIFRARDALSTDLLAGDGRIDYLWLSKSSCLRAVAARELFTPARYGRVSDHTGYAVEFEIR